ncbi:cornifelin-like [Nothobranchius furzeri]|uniref:Cornifelin-like n=1 Tax=Nothobranchius furzeri TaxID=105023 RepID=A0A9D2XIH9_NOTFU|nr:cornifelin-like [Nothobranchius furzeri]
MATDWSSGLLSCCDDCKSCCYGFWCCPCLACTVSEMFGENPCLPLCDILTPAAVSAFGLPFCVPPAGLSLRVAIRQRYGIKVKHVHIRSESFSRSQIFTRSKFIKMIYFFIFAPQGSLCKDICTSCFCVWCSWCQLHRELKYQKHPGVVTMQPR